MLKSQNHETLTLLLARGELRRAHEAGKLFFEDNTVHMHFVSESQVHRVWIVFQSLCFRAIMPQVRDSRIMQGREEEPRDAQQRYDLSHREHPPVLRRHIELSEFDLIP